MDLLALDLATETGWAKWHKRVTSAGTVEFKGDLGAALNDYQGWLYETLARMQRPVTVVFETPWVGPKTHQKTARRLQGMAAITEMECANSDCRCFEANTNSVLLHFTGKGGGKRPEKKARIIAACEARGLHPRDDNEADALALLDYAAHCLDIKTDIPEGPLFRTRAA